MGFIYTVCVYHPLVLIGYPPKPLSLRNTRASLTELGIRSGDTLIVEEQAAVSHVGTHHSSHEQDVFIPKITRRLIQTVV